MNEFNNRIAAQRKILALINGRLSQHEELFGLSRKAIERWALKNRVDPQASITQLLVEASAKLFFLANRSQEQVSEEYQTASRDISALAAAIEANLT